MKFKITKQETEHAKKEGMTAELLRADLFTTAIMSLNDYIASMAGAFNGVDCSRRIFTRESMTNYIGHRSVSILKETGIISVCGSGYTVESDNVPHKQIETMCQNLEQFYFA